MQAAFARPLEEMIVSRQVPSALRAFHSIMCRMRLTSRISRTPKNNRSVLVLLGAKDIVKSNGKAIQVANV
jgi:hypothetical protein